MSRRTERVNILLQQQVSAILSEGLNDPRLRTLVTVTFADVSPDLQNATIGITVMGSAEERQEALQGMQSSAGFLQRALTSRIRMRNTPRLRFVLDTSIEEGDRLLAVMDRIQAEEGTTENDQTPD